MRRVTMLEERMNRFGQLEAKLVNVERELMLSRASVSRLTSLQELMEVHKYADGHSLQACLRVSIKRKVAARPELMTAKRKRRASTLTVDYITTRRAVDRMLAIASLEAVSIRGVGGRVSGRFVRFDRHLEVLRVIGFSAVEASLAMQQKFPRLNGTVSTRLVLERHVDEEGSVWYIVEPNAQEQTVQVAQRSVCLTGGSQAYGVGQLVRSTVGMDTFSDLPTERPMFLRWVALGAAVRPAESADADVARRLTMSLPVCVVDDEALDPKSLL